VATYIGSKMPKGRATLSNKDILKAVQNMIKEKDRQDVRRWGEPDEQDKKWNKERDKNIKDALGKLSGKVSAEDALKRLGGLKKQEVSPSLFKDDYLYKGSPYFDKDELGYLKDEIRKVETRKTLDYQKKRERAMTPDMFGKSGSGG